MSQGTPNTPRYSKLLVTPASIQTRLFFPPHAWLFDSLLDSFDWEAIFLDKEDASFPEATTEHDCPSDPEDFTEQGLDAKKLVLGISKSIVSLVSSVGNFTISTFVRFMFLSIKLILHSTTCLGHRRWENSTFLYWHNCRSCGLCNMDTHLRFTC